MRGVLAWPRTANPTAAMRCLKGWRAADEDAHAVRCGGCGGDRRRRCRIRQPWWPPLRPCGRDRWRRRRRPPADLPPDHPPRRSPTRSPTVSPRASWRCSTGRASAIGLTVWDWEAGVALVALDDGVRRRARSAGRRVGRRPDWPGRRATGGNDLDAPRACDPERHIAPVWGALLRDAHFSDRRHDPLLAASRDWLMGTGRPAGAGRPVGATRVALPNRALGLPAEAGLAGGLGAPARSPRALG